MSDNAIRPERSLNWHLAWPDEEGPFATPMIERINKALQKPIKDLLAGELRQLLSQEIALEYTVPLAIAALRSNPMQHSSYYEGDLLRALLDLDTSFWSKNADQYAELKTYFESVLLYDKELQKHVNAFFAIEVVSVVSTKKSTKRNSK